MEEQHNKGKVEGFLAELGRKLDQLMDRARQGAEEAKLSDKFEDLKQTRDKLEQELHEFVKDDDKWREVKIHLQGAAQELQKAFETTFVRKKGDEENRTGFGNTNQQGSNASDMGNWDRNPEQRSGDWQENNPSSADWKRIDSDTTDPGANPR